MDLYQAGLTQVSALKHISSDVVSKKCGEFLTFGSSRYPTATFHTRFLYAGCSGLCSAALRTVLALFSLSLTTQVTFFTKFKITRSKNRFSNWHWWSHETSIWICAASKIMVRKPHLLKSRSSWTGKEAENKAYLIIIPVLSCTSHGNNCLTNYFHSHINYSTFSSPFPFFILNAVINI